MGKSRIEWTDYTFNPSVRYCSIPGFPAYLVGDDGSIWTCWGMGGKKRYLTSTWRQRKPDKQHAGHLKVTLYRGDGYSSRVFVHCLILELFVGQCPPGCEACHNDGNPQNNRLDNLRWDTPMENWNDRKKHGRGCAGDKNPSKVDLCQG